MHFSAPNLLLCYQQTHLVITAPSDATLARAAARLIPPVDADACFALRRERYERIAEGAERELDDGTRAGLPVGRLGRWGTGTRGQSFPLASRGSDFTMRHDRVGRDRLMLHGLLIRMALVLVLVIAIPGAAGIALMFDAQHADCVVCVLLVLYMLLELGLAMRRLERWIRT
jgi:hypothetical protein